MAKETPRAESKVLLLRSVMCCDPRIASTPPLSRQFPGAPSRAVRSKHTTSVGEHVKFMRANGRLHPFCRNLANAAATPSLSWLLSLLGWRSSRGWSVG